MTAPARSPAKAGTNTTCSTTPKSSPFAKREQHAKDRLRGGTAYVTLEPCNHTGRTGPCTEALIAAGLKRVVAATVDPNPNVAGHGAERLRAAGIEVTLGVCQAEARRINEGFARWIQHKRPLGADESRHDARRPHRPARRPAHRPRALLDHQRSRARAPCSRCAGRPTPP